MVTLEQPQDFNPKFIVAGCLLECSGKILLLHRQSHKPQGGSWGIPAGKVDPEDNGDIVQAVVREVFQETSCEPPKDSLQKIQTFYVRYPDYDFVYHYFKMVFSTAPTVVINDGEHDEYTWIEPVEALKLDLIPDEDFCMKYAYGIE